MKLDIKVDKNKLLTGLLPKRGMPDFFKSLYTMGSKRLIPAINLAAKKGNLRGFNALAKILAVRGAISRYFLARIDKMKRFKTLGSVT